MQLENITIIESKNEEFVADALEAVRLKFVDNVDGIKDAPGFEPEFAHQHFGETEKIVGYKNLNVSVCYSDSSLFLYPSINYEAKAPKDSDLLADDIMYKIRDTLPSSQLDALVTDVAQFRAKLHEQESFSPPGQLIAKFVIDNEEKRTFQLYKLEGCGDSSANSFLERAQSLAFWYIDAVCYTDYLDPRFFNYFLFETTNGNGLPKHIFAGYATLYRFFHYPDLDRVRIAQILLAPQFRHSGVGTKFLNTIYTDLCAEEKVYDITFEEPADSLLIMRHFTDCSNCCDLPEFSKEELLKGFSKEMQEAARKKFKLHAAQARRVYEILRLAKTKGGVAYKADVCKRLERPFLRSNRDYTRLTRALESGDLAVVSESSNPEIRRKIVDAIYAETLETYNVVIDRLRKFSSKQFH